MNKLEEILNDFKEKKKLCKEINLELIELKYLLKINLKYVWLVVYHSRNDMSGVSEVFFEEMDAIEWTKEECKKYKDKVEMRRYRNREGWSFSLPFHMVYTVEKHKINLGIKEEKENEE